MNKCLNKLNFSTFNVTKSAVLIKGLEGCGKKYAVECLAQSLDYHLLKLENSFFARDAGADKSKILNLLFDFISKYDNEIIVLFCNIDKLTLKQSESEQNETSGTINQNLIEFIDKINGCRTFQGTLIATANSSSFLNESLSRSGRFCRTVNIPLPDQNIRLNILKNLIQTAHEFSDEELKKIVLSTPGFVATDLKDLVQYAYWNAYKRMNFSVNEINSSSMIILNQNDFLDAIAEIIPKSRQTGFLTIPDVKWDYIGGMEDVKEQLKLSVFAPLFYSELCTALNVSMSNGILLHGPSGCGKTLLAKALANEAGINFISVKGPELLSMWVGESERAVRSVFQTAINCAPCVLFFDEIDSLCPARDFQTRSGSDHMARLTNQFLTEMDGMNVRKNVFVLAATNRVNAIDRAVLRPGRFDKVLEIPLPNSEERLKILSKHISTIPILENINVNDEFSDLCEDRVSKGFSGAELAGIVRDGCSKFLKHVLNTDSIQMSIDENLVQSATTQKSKLIQYIFQSAQDIKKDKKD